MNGQNKILITGGSGMVGSFLKQIMPKATYVSSKDYNLTSEKHVAKLFFDHKPKIIIHLAAKVGGIMDNINKPAEYFTDNVLINTLLFDYAYRNGVEKFIGILSTCIYPDVFENYPMKEEDLHLGPPTKTNFSYGYAKRCMAVQIDAYNKQYNTNYNYLIPCNLYGQFDKFEDYNGHFVSVLIKKIHKAKENNDDNIMLYGSGKPLRQFMYGLDLANVIKYYVENDISENLNVANPEIYSIDEIANIALKACDATHIKIKYDKTKPDGQYRKDVSIEKLKKILGNDLKITSLEEGIKKTYKIMQKEWKKK